MNSIAAPNRGWARWGFARDGSEHGDHSGGVAEPPGTANRADRGCLSIGGAIEALGKIAAVKAQVEQRRGGQEPKVPGHGHGVGVHLIAATLPLSYAVGLTEGKSALAETLVQALRHGNGLVTAGQVSAYVKDQLPVTSDHITHGFRQVALTDSIGLDFAIAAQ